MSQDSGSTIQDPQDPLECFEAVASGIRKDSDTSSSLVQSSPVIQTPKETVPQTLSFKSNNDGTQHKRRISSDKLEAWFLDQVSESIESPAFPELGPVLSDVTTVDVDDATTFSRSDSSVVSSKSKAEESGAELSTKLNMRSDHELPRYYTLETREAQVAFGRHLDKLLMAVIEERHICAGFAESCSESPSTSLSQETSIYASDHSLPTRLLEPSSVTEHSRTSPPRPTAIPSSNDDPHTSSILSSLTISPGLQDPSPSISSLKFIYVKVDEHSDDSQICNEDSCDASVSGSSCGSCSDAEAPSRVSAHAKFCHPSAHATQSRPERASTPLPTKNINVPQAPRKVVHDLRVRSSSPVRAPRSQKLQQGVKHDNEQDIDRDVANCEIRQGYERAHIQISTQAPQNKKRKLALGRSRDQPPRTLVSRFFAKEPASLRRAASLRSLASVDLLEDQFERSAAPTPLGSPRPDSTSGEEEEAFCLPTELCTPDTHHPNGATPSDTPLPLVAPPIYELIPRAPLSLVDVSVLRIKSLIRKDGEQREADGLTRVYANAEDDAEDEVMQDSEAQVEVLIKEEPEELSLPLRGESGSQAETDRDDAGSQLRLGIQESFRIKVVTWIFDVMPPSFKSKPQLCSHLRKQLLDSPDTRWHAAHMFSRYFLRIGTSPSGSPAVCERSRSTEEGSDSDRVLHGQEALTWDIAVACVALAVKFHRDVLSPLYPVSANEFLILAPHTMEYDDLESAQRDVFSCFSYCIGSNTPSAYMEELWQVLPSLRFLIEARGNWQVAKTEAWELLYDAMLDVAYLNYPIHILTSCALIVGTMEALVIRMKSEEAERLRLLANGTARRTKRREGACRCAQVQKKAQKAVMNVELDMQELLGVPKDLWAKCMNWLETIAEG